MPAHPLVSVTKTFTFSASHQLTNHDGKCRNLHGHTYTAEVVCEGRVQPAHGGSDEGMVIDFGRIKDSWARIEDRLDHRHLNISIGPEIGPATAENIARWILERIEEDLGPLLERVRLWESPTSCVEVQRVSGAVL